MEKEQNQKNNLAEDYLASDLEFRKQFDPNSSTFHKGVQQIVPVGCQKRIPESMPTEFDPNQQKISEQYLEDKQYIQTMELRNTLMEMKKIMPRLCAPIEAMLRIKSNLNGIEDDKMIKMEKDKIVIANEELKPLMKIISANEGYEEKYMKELRECIQEAINREFKDKEELTDFNFRVKRLTQAIFKEITTLLQLIKDIKKKYQ